MPVCSFCANEGECTGYCKLSDFERLKRSASVMKAFIKAEFGPYRNPGYRASTLWVLGLRLRAGT